MNGSYMICSTVNTSEKILLRGSDASTALCGKRFCNTWATDIALHQSSLRLSLQLKLKASLCNIPSIPGPGEQTEWTIHTWSAVQWMYIFSKPRKHKYERVTYIQVGEIIWSTSHILIMHSLFILIVHPNWVKWVNCRVWLSVVSEQKVWENFQVTQHLSGNHILHYTFTQSMAEVSTFYVFTSWQVEKWCTPCSCDSCITCLL